MRVALKAEVIFTQCSLFHTRVCVEYLVRVLYLSPCFIPSPQSSFYIDRTGTTNLWLAKWCKIHKVYIHSHSMLLLIFTNIFIHIQQPNLHSRNIFIHIYLCISYSRLYLLTFTRCLHSHSTSYIHSHSRSKYSFNIFCASPLRIGQYKTWTAEYGLRTTDWV